MFVPNLLRPCGESVNNGGLILQDPTQCFLYSVIVSVCTVRIRAVSILKASNVERKPSENLKVESTEKKIHL